MLLDFFDAAVLRGLAVLALAPVSFAAAAGFLVVVAFLAGAFYTREQSALRCKPTSDEGNKEVPSRQVPLWYPSWTWLRR